MCRYANRTYKTRFACFSCRRAFRKTALEDYAAQKGLKIASEEITKAIDPRRPDQASEAPVGPTRQQLFDRYLAELARCSRCAGPMAVVGWDFRPPPARSAQAWRILQVLYDRGFAFRGCGCDVGYAPPARISELPGWLRRHTRRSAGALLLESIERRHS
jgi:hypothetical protein